MPENDETLALLAAARQGNADARGRLFARHRDGLRRLVALRLDPALARRVDASDIVQDVLVEADRRLAEFLAAGKMPFHVWLRCLARDRIVDAHRHHRLAGRRSLDREQALPAAAWSDQSAVDLADLVRDRQATPAAAAIGHELEVRFQAALDRLDETDREIVLLRHFEQLSNGETAEILGLSGPAAGMRYLRAMRRLRTLLEEVPPKRETP
ncbi:MAG TPA: sigma-70 family RNA polymerase sigma factor [Pirellulales bacterium]|nr:sigma-70 family RNA polymerase sigma factor [Pirellulales bacterium]